jgi:hypothetical protein
MFTHFITAQFVLKGSEHVFLVFYKNQRLQTSNFIFLPLNKTHKKSMNIRAEIALKVTVMRQVSPLSAAAASVPVVE